MALGAARFRGLIITGTAFLLFLALICNLPRQGAAEDPTCLQITPYVMDVTATTAIVRWETEDKTTSRLCYRPAAGGAAWQSADGSSSSKRSHHVSVKGLTPETTFEYKVLTTDLRGASDCEDDTSLRDCSTSSRTGLGAHVDDAPLRLFACRAEYLDNRARANDFVDEPFLSEELALIAQLPEACEGEDPVPLPPLGVDEDEYGDERDNRRRLLAGADCSSLTQEFTTSPRNGACGRRFRSWWLGDSGAGSDAAEDNIDAAMKFMRGSDGEPSWDATFAIGDNAYDSGTESEYRRKFFSYFCESLAHVGFYPTLGNHEARTSDGERLDGPYFDLFMPGHPTASAYGSHYSYHNGRVHVVMLDLSYDDWDDDDGLFDWLEKDLSDARMGGETDWILVGNHFPPYSKGSHDSDSESRLEKMREDIVPILDKHGVDLTLSGHSHAYERSHLVHGHYKESDDFDKRDHMIQEGDGSGTVFEKKRCGDSGTVHVVTGSASKRSGGDLDHAVHDVSIREYCSLIIHIEGNELVATCVGEDEEIVDKFTIIKDMDPAGGCPSGRDYGPSCATIATPAPSPAPTPSPTMPEPERDYGFCSWSPCDKRTPVKEKWCSKTPVNCGKCKLTWCPTDGYCTYRQTCDGEPKGGVWCNTAKNRCEDWCGGRWCDVEEAVPTLAPTQAPGTCTAQGHKGCDETACCPGLACTTFDSRETWECVDEDSCAALDMACSENAECCSKRCSNDNKTCKSHRFD